MKIVASVIEIFIFAANELRTQDFSPIESRTLVGGPKEREADERNRKRQVCFWPSQEAGKMQAYRRERWRLPARLHNLQTAPEPLGRTRPSLKKPSQTEKWRRSSETPRLGPEGPGKQDDQGEVSFKTEGEVSPVRN